MYGDTVDGRAAVFSWICEQMALRHAGSDKPIVCIMDGEEPRKGVHVFARIAEVLSLRRPDITLLLVEGASKASFLPQLGIDLGGLKNLRIMPNSPDARQFLAATKILLMPSLMENAGLVAMEAMFNGIPVVASNRGGLPETIGEAGFLLDIPARYTPETANYPRPRRLSLGWRRSSVCGTTRRSTSAAAVSPASTPSNGIRIAWPHLSRVLQPNHPSARPAAGAFGGHEGMSETENKQPSGEMGHCGQ